MVSSPDPLAVLLADPVLRPLIAAGPPIVPRPQQDLYFALLRSVCPYWRPANRP